MKSIRILAPRSRAAPALRTRAEAPINIDIDAAIAELRATGRLQQRAFIRFPRALSNHYETMARRPGEPQARLYVDAETGELHESRQSYVFWYLRHLHVRLMSPFYGRVIVGVIGLAMLLPIVTGVLIHKHLFRDLFRMRWRSESGPRSLPPSLALFGGGIGSAALTPLFYGLWAITALWMFALKSATRMGRASLIAGGALTLLVTMLSFRPPVDPRTLLIGVGALPLAGGQWWIAAHLPRFRSAFPTPASLSSAGSGSAGSSLSRPNTPRW